MNVFIDTNIYLTFFHLSHDDLEELNKVFVLQKSNNITLWMTDQVVEEFRRNREAKLADALKRFSEERLNNQIPQMVKEYPEYDALRSSIKNFETAKNAVLAKLKRDIDSKSLKADQLISSIILQSKLVTATDRVLAAAKTRFDRGNPPGKNRSYGDAINWECLLSHVPKGEDLFLVTDDGDYFSPLNPDQFNGFLAEEWETKRKAKLFVYRRLSQFLADKFPSAKLASELEKEVQIKNLAESRSFARTHEVLGELTRFADFTPPQVNDIIGAYLSNGQVRWIICDQDIKDFGRFLLDKYATVIEAEQLEKFRELTSQCEEGAEEIPF